MHRETAQLMLTTITGIAIFLGVVSINLYGIGTAKDNKWNRYTCVVTESSPDGYCLSAPIQSAIHSECFIQPRDVPEDGSYECWFESPENLENAHFKCPFCKDRDHLYRAAIYTGSITVVMFLVSCVMFHKFDRLVDNRVPLV